MTAKMAANFGPGADLRSAARTTNLPGVYGSEITRSSRISGNGNWIGLKGLREERLIKRVGIRKIFRGFSVGRCFI
jgi:hypothetical protein